LNDPLSVVRGRTRSQRHDGGDDAGVPHLAGTAITTIGSCGKPFAFIDAEDRGYTFSIPTLTRTALSAVLVGSLGNGVVNSTPGGRFMSLLDSSSTNTDGAAPPEPSSSAGPAGQRLRQAGRCTGTTLSLSLPRLRTTRSSRSARSSTGPRLASAQQRVAHSSSLLGRLQRHAHRPGLRGQQHVRLAARVLRRRVVVFLHRRQRSGSRALYADDPDARSSSTWRLAESGG
jgi:hypothetical protein